MKSTVTLMRLCMHIITPHKVDFFLFVLERVARGWSRWRATVCFRVVYVVCVVAKKTSVAWGECERTRHNAFAWIRLSGLRCRFSFVGLNRFAILTVGNRQSRHWGRGDCVRPSRSVVVVALRGGGGFLFFVLYGLRARVVARC